MDNRSRRIRRRKKSRAVLYTVLSLITCTVVLGAVKIFDLLPSPPKEELPDSEENVTEFEEDENQDNEPKEDLLLKQEDINEKQSIEENEVPNEPQQQAPQNNQDDKQNSQPKQQDIKSSEEKSSTNNGERPWNLLLVNPWNKLPDGYTFEKTNLMNGYVVDTRAYPDLQQMMDDCRAEGLSPLICSAYRSIDRQTTLFNNQITKYKGMGYSDEEARKEASKWVAVPGTSEHHTGLALDIVATSNQNLTEEQANTAEQKWLMANSYKYGFILRYAKEKQDITGITYEPWHYRYVGKEVAKEIYEQGICLEEYIENNY